MPTALKASLLTLAVLLVSFVTPPGALGAEGASKLVTRVDFATVAVKGGKLIVRAQGAAHSKRGGRLVPHKSRELNKDGLLEYDFCYTPSAKDGNKLKSLIVTRKEPSTFVGIKGVRIYTEYKEMNVLIPEAVEKKKKSLNLNPFHRKPKPAAQ